jgi:hypothetical protein
MFLLNLHELKSPPPIELAQQDHYRTVRGGCCCCRGFMAGVRTLHLQK